jgi:hypothetical protein
MAEGSLFIFHRTFAARTSQRGGIRVTPNSKVIALNLLARGIAPVPVPVGEKGPRLKKWQELVVTPAN